MDKHNNPYIVIGTGRSGTSFVAGVLHNDMGINMGEKFPKVNRTNPDGFWEDLDFLNLNVGFRNGNMTFLQFMQTMVEFITIRQARNLPWGFKESRMSMFIGLYLQVLDQPKIIWTQRKSALVIASLQDCYGFNEDRATGFYTSRMLMIGRTLQGRDPLIIKFGKERIGKSKIISAVKNKWRKDD